MPRQRVAAAFAILTFAAAGGVHTRAQQAPDGQALFRDRCASCHAGSDPRIPTVDVLRQGTAASIVETLTNGAMRSQGAALSPAEREAVARFLATAPASPVSANPAPACAPTTPLDLSGPPLWPGWGPDTSNRRFQTADRARLTAVNVPNLKLKWAFGFPNATSARSQPTVAGGRVFVGNQDGTVYALDARTGCTAWTFKAAGGVRTAPVVSAASPGGGATVYFGDARANVYALDARTGAERWTRKVETHPSAHVTASPALFEGTLFVAISSGEEGQGDNAKYECCTFRGSVVALNTADGSIRWKTYTIEQEPRPLGRNRGGAVRWGPSGAGIWASPTIDPKRRLVYVATGNMYTEPQQKTSDAVIALDMAAGKIQWTAQVTPEDVFVVGCNSPTAANCADEVGPDHDFGNSAMLVTTKEGKDLLVIGQKSGVGWALDPDRQGAIVWQYRAGVGGALGGMEFGSAADDERAYFPVADGNRPSSGELHAVALGTGEPVWVARPKPPLCGERGRGCTPAILAAITAVPGVIFAGALDGGFRAYAAADGALLWEFDTNRAFTTVNGVPAKGASMSGPGAAVADGMVYVNSGYGALGGRPGNVLLAFGVD